MLRNCKVSRVLPRIADSAKNDRNAVLRARWESSFSSEASLCPFISIISGPCCLHQVCWICTFDIGILGRCSWNSTVSWSLWRPYKVLCRRCDGWGMYILWPSANGPMQSTCIYPCFWVCIQYMYTTICLTFFCVLFTSFFVYISSSLAALSHMWYAQFDR